MLILLCLPAHVSPHTVNVSLVSQALHKIRCHEEKNGQRIVMTFVLLESKTVITHLFTVANFHSVAITTV